MEGKNLLRELAKVWEKDIDEDYDIDWKFKKLLKILVFFKPCHLS